MSYLGRTERIKSIKHIAVSFETLCKLIILPLWIGKRITEKEFYEVVDNLSPRAKHDHPRYMVNSWGEYLAKQNKQTYMSREDLVLAANIPDLNIPDDVKQILAMFGMSNQHILKMFSLAGDMSYHQNPFEHYWETWLFKSDICFAVKPNRCDIHFDKSFGVRIAETNNKIKIPS